MKLKLAQILSWEE